jgi:hypothetical protein
MFFIIHKNKLNSSHISGRPTDKNITSRIDDVLRRLERELIFDDTLSITHTLSLSITHIHTHTLTRTL